MQYSNPYIELCIEGASSIFKGLPQKDKESLVQHHTIVNIKKGGYLFKEGEKPKGLICLVTGKVKLFKEGVGGRQQILKMVKQQNYIGFRTLYSEYLWSLSAIAIEESTICIFDKGSISRLIKKNPDIGIRFIRIISDELWFSYNRTVSLTQKHIRGRLAESLLILRDTYGFEPDGKTIKVALSREDIANLSNMTTSNGIRTLSNMASEGIIEMEGRKIRILENTELERISELG